MWGGEEEGVQVPGSDGVGSSPSWGLGRRGSFGGQIVSELKVGHLAFEVQHLRLGQGWRGHAGGGGGEPLEFERRLGPRKGGP